MQHCSTLSVLSKWFHGEMKLVKLARIGMNVMFAGVIVTMALVCSTADSPNIWTAMFCSLLVGLIVAVPGLVIVLLAAHLKAASMERAQKSK